MSSTEAQDKWIKDTLGLDAGPAKPEGGQAAGKAAGGAGFDRAAFERARAAWQDASDLVDKQVSGLRKLLLAQDDPELKDIADKGLNAITGTRKVGLAAALMDVAASGDPAAAAKAAKAAAAYRGFVESDPRVAVCDTCPAPVVAIRATLVPALAQLEQALGA